MKKSRILVLTLLTTLALMGCQSNSGNDTAMLEDQIEQLEQQVTALEAENKDLEDAQNTNADSTGTNSTAIDNGASSETDTLDSLEKLVNDTVAKTESASPSGSDSDKRAQFIELKNELEAVEHRMDLYEDRIEAEYRQGTMERSKFREEERELEKLEDQLDRAEDKLELTFGYDD